MIDVTFSIISGTKQTLRLHNTTTVAEAKQTLSVITDSPPHTLTLLHKAKILKDTDIISELDFSNRKFIAVDIRRKSLMLQKRTRNEENNEDETSPLKAIFGDSFSTVRQHFLENPASVPILIAYIARTDPVNARLLSESPQVLLRFLGITPEEFIVAINNMTQRLQNDPNQPIPNADLLNFPPPEQPNQNNVSEAADNQTENAEEVQTAQNQNLPEQENNHNDLQEQTPSNTNQVEPQISPQNSNQQNSVDEDSVQPPPPTNNDIDISSFLATMTREDLSKLETVLATNVSLEEAIPVFIRTGKNVDATIKALRQKSGSA